MDNFTSIEASNENCSTPSAKEARISEGMGIYFYGSFTILIVGTAGNVMSLLVLTRKHMRRVAMYNLLLLLSVVDTGVLWLTCLRNVIRYLLGIDVTHFSPTACRTVQFLFLSSTYLANWLIVLMTLERLFAVWFPIHVKTKWSLCKSRIAAAVTVLLATISNIHVFWTWNHVEYIDSATKEVLKLLCTKEPNNQFMRRGFEYVKMTIYCFVPFVIVLISNSLIIYRLHRSSKTMSSHSAGSLTRHVSETSDSSKERISFMLLTISFTWFLLMLPYAIIGVIPVLLMNVKVRVIVFFLMYINHAINFLLYCITGQKFREELMAMLFCRKKEVVRNEGARSTFKTDLISNGRDLRLTSSLIATQQDL